MIALLALLAVLQGDSGLPKESLPTRRDSLRVTSTRGSAEVPPLSSEEFVTHMAALTRLMRECGSDWQLFTEKRDEYLSSHGLTEDLLSSFVTDQKKEPVFWNNLWSLISEGLEDSLGQGPRTGDSTSLPLDRPGRL